MLDIDIMLSLKTALKTSTVDLQPLKPFLNRGLMVILSYAADLYIRGRP